MRWFRGHTEAPRLLSLSPLQADEDLEGASCHFHATSQYRDMSPVRWARRKSSSSESERNCYNVQTSQVTTERAPSKKDKKRIRDERRRICEKRNPLLDRVKNTRLSFFKDRDPMDEDNNNNNSAVEDDYDDEEGDVNDPDGVEFHSMCETGEGGLSRTEFRRSVCESDLKDITEEERTHARRKKRSKSQSRLPSKKQTEERFSFLGFRTATSPKSRWLCDSTTFGMNMGPQTKNWSRRRDFLAEPYPVEKVFDLPNNQDDVKDDSQFDSITPSSCLTAKFRAIQDRYLKSSTSKLIAKIYKKDGKEREGKRLRSFSYGTLPGLDELRTNPLYEDQDQDDNDSGILDNDSATSSLLDDRCSSGASGLLSGVNESTNILLHREKRPPPQLPPRKPSSSIADVERATRVFSSLDMHCIRNDGRSCLKDNLQISVMYNEERLCQAANNDLIEQVGFSEDHRRSLESEHPDRLRSKEKSPSEFVTGTPLPVVTTTLCTTETMVVKLPRESPDQCLGIFIAKTAESSPGYLVAHVVPNGLADKDGTLRIGDEILIVNGKRLRGLSMAEARKILGIGSGPGVVDIVVSRYSNNAQRRRLNESSVDYENLCTENGYGVIIENSPSSHFRKHHSKQHKDRRNESNRSISSDKGTTVADSLGPSSHCQTYSNFCTLPRRPRSTVSTFHTIVFEKGPGKKSLGFTIVGGRDSPKGSIGIFIKSVLSGGQAAEDGRLRAGDEILAVNGQVCHDLMHKEAVQLFRNIKSGSIALHLCRRMKNRDLSATKAKSCADLLLIDS